MICFGFWSDCLESLVGFGYFFLGFWELGFVLLGWCFGLVIGCFYCVSIEIFKYLFFSFLAKFLVLNC